MRILAFMQNPWFPPGTDPRHVKMYRDEQEFHRAVLGRSMSGRRLMEAFGYLYQEIHWDNVAPEAATESPGRTEIDHDHVKQVIDKIRPELILTFGTIAADAVSDCSNAASVKVMECHHPNARHRTQNDLNQFAQDVRTFILNFSRGVDDGSETH